MIARICLMYDACCIHRRAHIMRVTTELDQATYEVVRQRARIENRSMSALLGALVVEALQSDAPRLIKKGRFTVVAGPANGSKVSASQVQAVIDAEGAL